MLAFFGERSPSHGLLRGGVLIMVSCSLLHRDDTLKLTKQTVLLEKRNPSPRRHSQESYPFFAAAMLAGLYTGTQ